MRPADWCRFTAKFSVDATTGCWVWRTGKPYPRFRLGRRSYGAHRLAYEHVVGGIPDGLTLDHLCRNTACVNPDHLEAVTQRENVLRGVGVAASNAVKLACDAGHEYTPENTYVTPAGYRQCRACRRAIDRARRPRGARRITA